MRELYYPSSLSRHTKYRWSYKDAIPKKDTSIKAYLQRIDKMLPLHIHDFYELNIIISGDGRHYIGNRNVPTQKGDVFIIPPDISHGYFTDGSLDMYCSVIHLCTAIHWSCGDSPATECCLKLSRSCGAAWIRSSIWL